MFKKLLLTTAALVASVGLSLAGGAFSQFPILGVPANTNCLSFGNNGVCNQYSPAGPTTTTGNETIPMDSNLPNGQQPSTFLAPLSALQNSSQGAFRNALIGADFNINLWQRGTSFASITPTTATMTADRWFAYSSGNTATVNRQTGAADINTAVGLLATMRVIRPSGTDVTPICVGQVIPSKETARFLGNNAIFSFYALAPTTLSATNDSVDVTIAYATATDSATPGTNTDAFAKGTITGYTAVVTKGNNDATNTTVASGSANISLNSTMTRYYVSGVIPVTATSLMVKICTTPIGTGASTDYFEFGNAQLDAAAATTSSNLGVVTPGSFSRRQPAVEANLMLSYSYVLTDTAITTTYGWCQEKVANTSANCTLQFPVQMRGIPTTTVSAAGWSIQQTDATNELCSALAGVASSNTVLEARLLCTAPGTIALGVVSPFLGGATTSTITFSAEP